MAERVEKERMRTSQTGTSSKEGFTLIELIVVIFIISLFLAITVPSFTGIESHDTRTEVKRFASILRYLNDTASARKEELNLTVNFGDHSISYTAEEGEKRERIEYLRSVFLQTKGTINDGSVKITFTPMGAGEFLKFYFDSNRAPKNSEVSGKTLIVVELNPLSGRVRIDEI